MQIEILERKIQTANDKMLEFMNVRSRTLSGLLELREKVINKHRDVQAAKITRGTANVIGTVTGLALAPFTGGMSLGVAAVCGLGGIAADVLAQSEKEKFTKDKFSQIEALIRQDRDAICHVANVCTDIESDSSKLELMISGLAKGSVLVAATTSGVTRSISMMTHVLKVSKQTVVTAKGVSAVVIQTNTLSRSMSNSRILSSSLPRSLGLWFTAVSIPIDIYTLTKDIMKYNDDMHKSEEVRAINKLICDLNKHREEEKRKFDESIENNKKLLSNWKKKLKKYML